MLSNRTSGNLGRGSDRANALRAQTLNLPPTRGSTALPIRQGFDRILSDGEQALIPSGYCVVTSRFVEIQPGGSITIEPDGELVILGG